VKNETQHQKSRGFFQRRSAVWPHPFTNFLQPFSHSMNPFWTVCRPVSHPFICRAFSRSNGYRKERFRVRGLIRLFTSFWSDRLLQQFQNKKQQGTSVCSPMNFYWHAEQKLCCCGQCLDKLIAKKVNTIWQIDNWVTAKLKAPYQNMLKTDWF